MPTFYEFFAGAGMVRAGLGDDWQCLYANDFSADKCNAYRANWGGDHLHYGDIKYVNGDDLPGVPDLVWGSFPCQDLSVNGYRVGLDGNRSAVFWDLIRVTDELIQDERKPKIVAFENVPGLMYTNGGQDFARVCTALNELGYWYGAFIMDADLFLPHARSRIFIVGVDKNSISKDELLKQKFSTLVPRSFWHTSSMQRARENIPEQVKQEWIWWRLSIPAPRDIELIDVLDYVELDDGEWLPQDKVNHYMARLNHAYGAKVEDAEKAEGLTLGTITLRTETDTLRGNIKYKLTKVKFDGVANCVVASDPTILIAVDDNGIRVRNFSGREVARLMGLPDSYRIHKSFTKTMRLLGDGVAVPVVRHLAAELFEPLLRHIRAGEVASFRRQRKRVA